MRLNYINFLFRLFSVAYHFCGYLLLVAVLLMQFTLYETGFAAHLMSREQALKALKAPNAKKRQEAVSRLIDVGRPIDTDALVAALRDKDENVRALAGPALWQVWSRSGDPKVDKLFKQGVEQMSSRRLEAAISTFTEIIRLKPEFAEGWNKRATVYFMAGKLKESLADCDEAIKRNPKHFGALAGYGIIYTKMEDFEHALEYFERALEVNPNLEEVERNIEIIKDELAARGKSSI